MNGRRVVVVGGGIAGSCAALRLAQQGHEVVLIERSEHLGGLVMSLDIAGTPLERFYHHIFPHETEIIGLIGELGLSAQLGWFASSVGMLLEDRLWPFTSPLDLLRFSPLPLADRLHTGIGALRCARERDWESLDSVRAADWLASVTGERGTQLIWEPLLRAKFGSAAPNVPAAWMLGRFQQRAAARRGGRERLGYLRGGFRQIFDALEVALPQLGVRMLLGTGADEIEIDADRVHGVRAGGESIGADAVVFAGTLPALDALVAPRDHDPRWGAIGSLGAMCVVVEMARKVTDLYWVNVCDPDLPITAYIEHTNLVPAEDYDGRHLAYLGRYFTHDEPIASVGVEAEAQAWTDALGAGVPGFDARDVIAVHAARTPYAAPLVSTGYAGRIPPLRSHIEGLYVCTTAQIYPQDRGMSEGVRLATQVAAMCSADAGRERASDSGAPKHDAQLSREHDAGVPASVAAGWICPACGGSRSRVRFGAPSEGSEGGVSAEAFRPSSERFGETSGVVLMCRDCGHGSVWPMPSRAAVTHAYADAADPVSLREEAGSVETARRGLARLERVVAPGALLDIGCWTGSLLVAAHERGWRVQGIEPSEWAAARARARGLEVTTSTLESFTSAPGSFRAIAACDVLEHLASPGDAIELMRDLLQPGGAIYVTVPDAGSVAARILGRRWWSVLPMHLQYFTPVSLARLVTERGFRVHARRTHAKVFTARYYAERLGGYSPLLARSTASALQRGGAAERLIAPNFGDRMELIAVRD